MLASIEHEPNEDTAFEMTAANAASGVVQQFLKRRNLDVYVHVNTACHGSNSREVQGTSCNLPGRSNMC